MSSGKDVRVVHTVFAVREDQDGRQPVFVDQPLKLDAMSKASSSVLFRLSASIIDSASAKTIIYLQITPDRIASLRNTTCDTSDSSDRSPPCLEQVRQRLGGIRFVTRLQFQLHTGIHAQLVVPTGFTFDEASDIPTRRTFSSATLLATASLFSLYIPPNALPKIKFQSLAHAVGQFPTLTAAQRQAYERMVDLRRLYHGKGGIVFTPEYRNGSPLPDTDRKRSSTPATTDSYATTVPFDTPPRYQDSPPRYDKCPREGQQPPKARSDAIAISAESPGADCAPPGYNDPEWRHNVSKATKRVLHCGSEDIDLQTTYKKKYSRATGYTTPASARNTQQRPARMSPSHLVDTDCSDSRLKSLLERQRQQIEQLRADIEGLKRRNKELEGRHDELEDNCYDLENRQVESEETIESLLIHTGELDDECERLGKQMPDICEEMEDWVKDNMGDRMKESMETWLKENMADTMKGYIDDQVAAQIAQVKTKMRRALQG
ncbi:hypothetical protein CTA2_4736 [Colletotrichum tanaceti]|uniref:Uncharacterized protein n=1 Tax=Colletotrichum tanaceti TaxID=1306861 RepID=A0A4V6DFZ3_9PEZI|nr:hypothetical protein CTA2_4736 [Colletotrichum tanaceti]TKW50926.1 hypothetical protein CTA1_1745 [Colletotrichum tanaceti]